ncbi:MAG: hypothetical protein P1T08_18540 [Acidimicrobiia bacterium]|nr:hypothetical protein [Acidimicrobiia bacterium]
MTHVVRRQMLWLIPILAVLATFALTGAVSGHEGSAHSRPVDTGDTHPCFQLLEEGPRTGWADAGLESDAIPAAFFERYQAGSLRCQADHMTGTVLSVYVPFYTSDHSFVAAWLVKGSADDTGTEGWKAYLRTTLADEDPKLTTVGNAVVAIAGTPEGTEAERLINNPSEPATSLMDEIVGLLGHE